ncbi:hypothetical protein RHGRI_005486 [Rhododendron griersonianum]|uniref:DYW domain-containing protein n=1 Tax=Rhododendron griersonianum TaxID=479676 RepID=A0AAV6LD89_9ERIC|nr:hypothetical protein RHGRI_005486 [Rhododendron griersonianum]
MYRRRATLLTINSFTAFSKVRRSCNSLYSIEWISFVRNHITAAERSEFQNPNGLNGEDSIGYEQNPNGFYSGNQNHVGFQHKTDGYGQEWRCRGNTGEFEKNPDGFYKGNTVGVLQNPRVEFQHIPVGISRGSNSSEYQGNPVDNNPDGFYRENAARLRQNPIVDFRHKPIGQNGNFASGDCRESNGKEYIGNPIAQNRSNFTGSSGEMQQNPMGKDGFREGQSVVEQNRNGFSGQRASGFSGGVNGNYGRSDGEFKQGASDHYPNNYSVGNTGMTPQSPDIYYSGSSVVSQHHQGNYYGSNDQMNPRTPIVNGRHSVNTRVTNQNLNDFYRGNGEMAEQNPSNFRPGSTGSYQHGMGTHYEGSGTMYQQSSGVYCGDSAETPNGHVMQNVGESWQNPSGSYNTNAQNYGHKSFEMQHGMMDSQVSGNSEAQGESVEGAERSQHNGTIEELDGFCKEGKLKEVVEVLGLLERQHIRVDLPRYLMLMKACGDSKALEEAKYIHNHLMKSVSILEVSTYNKILEMYGQCGSMEDAYMVFNKMPQRNLTSWDTMIIWLAKNGHGEEAIDLFAQFKKSGLKPDGPMFFGVFSACTVLGDIVEGMLHFESMSKDYGISPSMVQYVSVVDMLGSVGYLDEALEFIEKMPVEPNVVVWETLMNASRVHGHTELGDRCAELVELVDPTRLDEKSKAGLIPAKAADIAKDKEKKKLEAGNLLAARSRVHEYRAGDKSHPEADKIYAQLRGMKEQMKEAGYVPETRFVLHDIDQESKEEALLAHSERLAVAFGLMSSPARAQMRIIKNLRVCGDCHSALKIISKLVGRELVIRDAKRFHHFKDGLCSCRDYW